MPRGGDRRSKPAALKKAEGNRTKVKTAALDAAIEREPKGRGKPVLPTHLSDAELAEFQHVLDTAPSTILTGADQRLIENYSVAAAAAREASVALAKTGKLVQGAEGPMLNPYWRIWRQASNDARMMGNELGLSPASRARLSAEPERGAGNAMELLLGMSDDPAGAWAMGTKQ